MSDAMAAILKFINGRNDNRHYLQGMIDYVTDSSKTDNGRLVATHGCSHNHLLEDILTNKKLHHKSHGKQGEHFVISFNPHSTDISYVDVLNTVYEIVSKVYPEYMAVIAVHTDSKCPHAHVVLDSVNAVSGRKLRALAFRGAKNNAKFKLRRA